MANVNELLAERLKKKEQSGKMEKMAKQSATGNLTSFSGVFNIAELSDNEKETLQSILMQYSTGEETLNNDLHTLISITSEVKAITNQAVLLHGERIKKAQTLLKKYQEGAFTSWLIATYGNRQTPYNFLQYYEFSHAMPSTLRPLIEQMPRQAVYTLATRDAPLPQKQKFIENYKGQTKQELLELIRELFPLDEEDKRKQSPGETTIHALKKLSNHLTRKKIQLSKKQKTEIQSLLDSIYELIS
jgi:hypothetical protein